MRSASGIRTSTTSAAGSPTTGCRTALPPPCTDREAAAIFDKRAGGSGGDPDEHEQFASYLMLLFGRLDARKGLDQAAAPRAPARNVNTRMLRRLGRDTGYDSIGDYPPSRRRLPRYLDRLEQDRALPKTILYNNNPADNYTLATMIGNFQDGSAARGSCSSAAAGGTSIRRTGSKWQIDALSNVGLLAHFVGMLTDSRSFMSYPRHEYFRRVLCNLLGARDGERRTAR